MKQFRTILLLTGAIALFSGCEKFKEKTFDTTIPLVFEVTIADAPASLDIDLTQIASVLGVNAELEDAVDGIKSYTFKEIRYKVWEYYDDPAALIAGHIGVGNTLATEPGVQIALTDISLQGSMDDPDLRPLDVSQQSKDKMQQYLLDTNGLKIFLDATVTHQPVHFKLGLEIDVATLAEVKKK